jgi:DNA-binding response OmpR family regulator
VSGETDDVWVVEDDLALLSGLVTLFTNHGLRVRGFSDPKRAHADANAHGPPRVLITDFAMPELNGVELARVLRDGLKAACPRLVLITGAELRRVELTLFDHVVRKPFRFDELVQKVQSWLSIAQSRPKASHVRMQRITPQSGKKTGSEGT